MIPYLVMICAPMLFSTNIIFGRYVAQDTSPFVLASLRWLCVAAILLPLAYHRNGTRLFKVMADNRGLFLALAFLGMGISGGGVYWGLSLTTATNATLIYTTSPILIILLERIFLGRAVAVKEIIGAALAFTGVALIVLRGDFTNLLMLNFNFGDLLIAAASVSWAGYSIVYRSKALAHLDSLSLFAIIALCGGLVNLPVALVEIAQGGGLPQTQQAWMATMGIVLLSSILAFSAYQYGIRKMGPSLAGLFMFLMTPWGVVMAVTFLGEKLEPYHFSGIIAVMAGVGMATIKAPKKS